MNRAKNCTSVRILGACEKSPRKHDKSLGISVSPNSEFLLECVSRLLPGVADRSEFTSAVVTHVPLWNHMFLCHVQLVLVTVNFTQVTLLNHQSINCLML